MLRHNRKSLQIDCRAILFGIFVVFVFGFFLSSANAQQESNQIPPLPATNPQFLSNQQQPSNTQAPFNPTPQSNQTIDPATTQATYTSSLSTSQNSQSQNQISQPSTNNNSTNKNTLPLRPQTTNQYNPIQLDKPGSASEKSHTHSGWGNFGTMMISLGFVLGLFWVTMKLLNRGVKQNKRTLPRNVVEILGNAPVFGRQSLQVIRFGNKILLVALSPAGYDTLTEITDPVEVDRLAGLCHANSSNSSTSNFTEILGQLTSWRPKMSEEDADSRDREKSRSMANVSKIGSRDLQSQRTGQSREVPHA